MAVSSKGICDLQPIIISWIRVFAIILTFSVAVNSNGRCGCAHNRPVGNGKCFYFVSTCGPNILICDMLSSEDTNRVGCTFIWNVGDLKMLF